MTETEILTGGINKIWASDDIAIIVLFLCLIFSGMFNIFLLRGLLSIKETLSQLTNALTVLNERIKHD